MTDELTLPLEPSRYGLKEDERKALTELADQLQALGDRQLQEARNDPNWPPTGATWSTEGWHLAGKLREFIDRLDRTLRTANEVLEAQRAEVEQMRAQAKLSAPRCVVTLPALQPPPYVQARLKVNDQLTWECEGNGPGRWFINDVEQFSEAAR